MSVINALLPLASVLLGAAITYVLTVRSRSRAEVDQVFHAAISAVAVAVASTSCISRVSWGGSTAEDEDDLARSAGREFAERHLSAVADARAAVARASAYDPELSAFYRADNATFTQGDDLLRLLRANLRWALTDTVQLPAARIRTARHCASATQDSAPPTGPT